MSFMGPSRLTVHSRPSSWGSATDECRSPSDTGSPSCFTLSTVSGSTMTSGTLPFAFTDSPISPENSTTSSLARMAWKPLDVKKGNDLEHPEMPPLPKFPVNITSGAATQTVKVETRTITYSQSIRSEHPNILDTPTPTDFEPLPKICYVPPKPLTNARQYPIGTAIGSSSPQVQYNMGETLHTDIIPGKTVPPQISEVESPAAESFYHGSSSRSQASNGSTPHTQTTVTSTPHTQGTVSTTPLTQASTQYESPGLRFGFSPNPAATSRMAPGIGPISIKSPPTNITGEWHPPPQTPTRALSLSARPSVMPQVPPIVNQQPQPQPQPSHSHSGSTQSQAPSHGRTESTSSTTGLISAPGRTRSFSGNKPSPFKLNPGNQVFPGPPGTNNLDIPQRMPTSKFSDDGDGDDNDNDGTELAKKQWKVHCTVPLTLSLLFFCGLMSAAVNHVYYSQLHGTQPSQEFQQWHTRAGIAIAIFTIACWVGCVAICYKQRVWSTFIQKNVKISGIDALWGLVQDPSLFLVGEAWKKSKVAMGLGIILWILPVTTIFVPGSLTIRPHIHGNVQGCLVPTFNPPAADQKILSPEEMDRLLRTKPEKDVPLRNFNSDGIVLTTAVKRVATVAAISGMVPSFELPEGCGNGGNCSYTASFTAPGYKCDVATTEDARKNGPWGVVGFDKIFVENGRMTFFSAKPDNRTKSPAAEDRLLGLSANERLGFGSFWIAHRTIGEEFTTADPSLLLDPSKGKKEMYKDEIFHCTDYVVAYEDVKFEFMDGRMDVQLSNAENKGIRFITPVDYTQYSKNKDSDLTDAAVLSRVAHEFSFSLISGEIQIGNSTLKSTPQIPGTALVDESRFYGSSDGKGIGEKFNLPRADLKGKVEEFHRNVTLAFLSQPRLKGTFYAPAKCQSTVNGLIYQYRSLALLVAYGIACSLTTIAIVVGIISLRANGFATDFSFSRILSTTRNPILDGITKGESCLGTSTERVGRQELRFGEVWIRGGRKNKEKRGLGVVREEDDVDLEEGKSKRYGVKVGHAAFGVPSEVMALRKGRGYA